DDGVTPTNAPEGIHRDGADYIVSALVMERDDVDGGMSIVYDPAKDRKLLEMTLTPGQGLFQADQLYTLPAEQWLWHNVTPVTLHDTDGDRRGSRNIFGFDVVLHRPQRAV
ncbi:MAG: 2OG-Fe dioxygenase family protein, partial [bacterium]|nr:2OG-Fe dioxygenase family protein [bacterium]